MASYGIAGSENSVPSSPGSMFGSAFATRRSTELKSARPTLVVLSARRIVSDECGLVSPSSPDLVLTANRFTSVSSYFG